MFGTILSLHYIGRKRWIPSIIFWVAYLIVTAVVSGALYTIAPTVSVMGLLIGFAVFMALAHYWYKFPWEISLKLFVIAFIIDFIIAIILVAVLVVTLPEFWGWVFPQAGIL